jgi:maltose O-acetyltransferase
MKNPAKYIALLVYYLIAKRFPSQPAPGWRIGYSFRKKLAKHIFATCGRNVIIKQHAYFGTGVGIGIGDRSQIGERSTIGAFTQIGRDVIMGPRVIIGHHLDKVDIPINQQEGTDCRPVEIADDVWIGQRAIIMPGLKIGSHTVIGAGSIVTEDVPEGAIVAGIPARVIRMRD